ncbi:MAG: tRNA lysidine(34) synthetase TilS [Myxococcota bacterium]
MTEERQRLLGILTSSLSLECGAPEGASVAVACSGGADSVALVSLLAAQRHLRLVAVYFVDHGLRDVTAEAQSATAAADRAGVPFHRLTLNLAPGGNLQARARAARYAALEAAIDEGTLIATGHTQTDQAETVLQRIMRGAGSRGLQAVRARRGRIIRPMLGITRAETRALGERFVDDPTNAALSFQRNRIRHTLVPILTDEAADIESSLALIASQAVGEHALLRACMAKASLSLEEVATLGLPATEAWLRLDWPKDTPASREVVRGLAMAAVSGRDFGPARLNADRTVSLRSGRVHHEVCPDPRMRVVAPSPGAYRLLSHRLVIKRGVWRQQTEQPIHTTSLDDTTLIWPITAHQERTAQGVGDQQASQWAFRLTDGAGGLLWASGQPMENNKSGRDLHIALFVC